MRLVALAYASCSDRISRGLLVLRFNEQVVARGFGPLAVFLAKALAGVNNQADIRVIDRAEMADSAAGQGWAVLIAAPFDACLLYTSDAAAIYSV